MIYNIIYYQVINSANKPKVRVNNHIKAKLFICIWDDSCIYIIPAYPSIIVLLDAAQKLFLFYYMT